MLLLSATPHSGKSEAFARLLGLLDETFLHGQPLLRANVAPLVVRTEKRHATDMSGRALFRPRTTRLVTVPYGRRTLERSLYEAVTNYVRHGYRRARAERRPAVGFLVLLMQRLVSSSTAAIFAALERRLIAVTTEGHQLRLFNGSSGEWADLSGEEQQAALADAQGAAWGDEAAEVELLIDLARKSISDGIDAKARYLVELLGQVARDDGDPAAKAVIFTEFVPTQRMLLHLLDSGGVPAVAVNGSMSIAERQEAQDAFRTNARVLVSTDAGGEGVNLQFAHVVVNYDLPWSPSRLEQRIGRVDRIGQAKNVSAFNLVVESSIDVRVLEVLEAKLAVILDELGADKYGDVLTSVDTHVEDLYAAAILDPTSLHATADAVGDSARRELENTAQQLEAMGPSLRPTPGARPKELRRWLDAADAARLRLADAGLPAGPCLPEIVDGEPVPRISGPTPGWWTMWEIAVGTDRTMLTLYLTDRGAIRPDLADRLWRELADGRSPGTSIPLDTDTYQRLRRLAVDHGYRQPGASLPSLALRLAVRVQA